MNGELGTAAGRSDLVHLALRLIVEEALESEVADALGREYAMRAARARRLAIETASADISPK
jgi:putative transposase